MVSIYAGLEQAYGLLSNISGEGACVVAGVHFEPNSTILLRISFDPEGEPFTTEARVIWSRDESESEKKATFVHGLKFSLISEEQRGELQAILSKPDFNKPVVPGNSSMRQGLGDVMEDLSQDLDKLGGKLGEE
jgi:hypothetical protein